MSPPLTGGSASPKLPGCKARPLIDPQKCGKNRFRGINVPAYYPCCDRDANNLPTRSPPVCRGLQIHSAARGPVASHSHWKTIVKYGPMLIGERLPALREAKGLTQDVIERLTGIKRSRLSRYENCHLVPSLGTLEKLAVALGIPLWQLFYGTKARGHQETGKSGREWLLDQLRPLFARMDQRSRSLLLHIAGRMAKKKRLRSSR
jgi:transcriptional regulator with XRE-family HTH domain